MEFTALCAEKQSEMYKFLIFIKSFSENGKVYLKLSFRLCVSANV